MTTAEKIMEKYRMSEVPDEGGYFVRTYTAADNGATCILYLLRGKEISRWHKLSCDEIWMYHEGSAARQILLFGDGHTEERLIGPESPQSVIPAGTWQSTRLEDPSPCSFGLFGTSCVPGFGYERYTGGTEEELVQLYPDAEKLIRNTDPETT